MIDVMVLNSIVLLLYILLLLLLLLLLWDVRTDRYSTADHVRVVVV